MNEEDRRQAGIVQYVRLVAPHIIIFAVPNGGLRTKREAAKLKWTGVLAGVLDLVLVLPDARVAFWETKIPGSYLSKDQRDVVSKLLDLGHRCAIVRDIDDAREELEKLGVSTRDAYAPIRARAPGPIRGSPSTKTSWPIINLPASAIGRQR